VIWFLMTLVVLVMGGVALVAAGYGQPMSDAHDDRPDALVPAAGPLGGEHLRKVRFSLAFRGYRMSEVDTLLDRLARQLEEPVEEPVDEPVDEPTEEPFETAVVQEPRGDDDSA
jgi:DivIVA domain-containing protein